MELMAHHVHWGMSASEMVEEVPEAIVYHLGVSGIALVCAVLVGAAFLIARAVRQ